MNATFDDDAYQDQVMYLLQNGLFESAEVICSFGISVIESKNKRAPLLELFGDALFAQGQFKRAANYFQQSFEAMKQSSRIGDPASVDTKEESRIMYKQALCCVELKDASGALKLLEKIPAKFRNIRVNITLGRMYVSSGLKRHAIESFKNVLTLLPIAVEAIDALILLGVEATEIVELLRTSAGSSPQWSGALITLILPKLADALECKFRWKIPGISFILYLTDIHFNLSQILNDDLAAIVSFEELNSQLPRNPYILTNLGTICAATKGLRLDESLSYFKKARVVDKWITRDMDTYSSALLAKGDIRELSILAGDMVSLIRSSSSADSVKQASSQYQLAHHCSETWVTAAMHAVAKGDLDRAMDYIDKVTMDV